MTTMPAYASRYLAGSGAIVWDRNAAEACRLDATTTATLQVAAILEEDTAISAAHARSFGLDRAPDLDAFLRVWEPEEAEHGRILRALAGATAGTSRDPRPKTIAKRRRRIAAVSIRCLGRASATGLVYCTLGAAAEYLAVISYTALTAQIQDTTAGSLLRAITHQEGRHLAFFLAAARARGTAISPMQARLARRALLRLWEPIGVSSLGSTAWRALNGHWLDNDSFRARAARMDAMVNTIPGLTGLALMGNFLREWDRTQTTVLT